VNDYIELTKPRITWLILMSTAIGYYFGHHGSWSFWPIFHAIVGTGLIASGTAALNQWYEREADVKMRRTQGRPIPSGRVTPVRAFWFGMALEVVGSVELWLGLNALTSLLGIATILLYLCAYTPLKQKTWWSTTVGAIPGAIPPLIGYAAASGTLRADAWVLFAILFIWQFPHFYAIAWMYREDYSRAGIRMLPVVEPDGVSTSRQILLYSVLLVPISLLPHWLGMSGSIYLVGALAMGLMFLYSGIRVSVDRTKARARRVLLASVIYLPVLYGLMVLDPARL
jgi:protoheme IX farnesyltransferase